MARPRKQTVDYFPHMCNHGKTIYVLEQRYGNDGYAFWFKLLEMIGNTEGHYLRLDNPAEMEFLAAKTRLDVSICREILDLLATMGAIDAELWVEQVVWSDNFVANVSDVYKKRKAEIPQKPSFGCQKPHTTEVSDPTSQQKSTNKTKVNKTKGDNTSTVSGPETPTETFTDENEHVVSLVSGIWDKEVSPGTLNSLGAGQLTPWFAEMDMGIELLSAAIQEAKKKKQRVTPAYVAGILRNWHAEGITRIEHLNKNTRASPSQQHYSPPPPKRNTEEEKAMLDMIARRQMERARQFKEAREREKVTAEAM